MSVAALGATYESMVGLIIVIIVIAWLAIACAIAFIAFRAFSNLIFGTLTAAVLLAVLVPLPLLDEILGKRQFEKLCRDNAVAKFDQAKLAGKTVYLSPEPSSEVEGTLVRISIQRWRFLDAATGETVLSYNTLNAGRRFFIKGLGPFTFHGYCAPGGAFNASDLFKELGVTQVQRSQVDKKDTK